jgi:cytosine/creatinine deaminase
MSTKDTFLAEAIAEAKKGLSQGGIPIGSVLVCDGEIIGRGHNRRVQDGSAIHHAEMNCFENAGRLRPSVYRRSTLYTTLSPCFMCAGAAVFFGVKKVVVGEKRTISMSDAFLRQHGVEVEIADDAECYELLQGYIRAHPEVWDEDKGDH